MSDQGLAKLPWIYYGSCGSIDEVWGENVGSIAAWGYDCRRDDGEDYFLAYSPEFKTVSYVYPRSDEDLYIATLLLQQKGMLHAKL